MTAVISVTTKLPKVIEVCTDSSDGFVVRFPAYLAELRMPALASKASGMKLF
jgi:hypothetical protein